MVDFAETGREAAATLREILALIVDGEMSASPAMVRRLEGAVSALQAVGGDENCREHGSGYTQADGCV